MHRLFVLVVVALAWGCGKVPEPSPVGDASGAVVEPAESKVEIVDFEVPSFDGVELAYSLHGEGEPAVVFAHGWLGNRSQWSAQAPAIAETHRVVLVDLAGHGESGTDRETWSLESFGRDVEAVANAAGLEKMIVVGHSMGGQVGLEVARLMPDRVVAIIGVESLHDPDPEFERAHLDALIEQYVTDFRGSCTRFVDSMFSADFDPKLLETALDDMCGTSPEGAIATLRTFPDYDIGAAMAAAGVPIRVINGGLIPTDIEAGRAYNEDFEAIIMDVPSHYPMLERPDEFNERLREAIDGVVIR